jgi:DNA-binding response OmpR family regulator
VARRLQRLPIMAPSNDKGAARAAAAGRRIVIVDDDNFVREAMAMTLEVVGHRIRSTGSGYEALRWLEDEPCDLLIVDVNMPEMDGAELHRRVLARWPISPPRMLFVSGDTEVSGDEHDPDILAAPRLVKPFSLGDLVGAVTRTLETPSHVGI